MNDREAGEFLHYLDKLHARTARVARCIPEDRLEWKYRDDAWTLGDLLRHLGALERWMFAENVQLRPSRYPGHGPELASGLSAVLEYYDRMHEESMEIFRYLSGDDWQRRCVTPGGAEIRVWKWLRAMVEHEAHHRGQIYTILGLAGVETPPLYGLTSEQVKDRSE